MNSKFMMSAFCALVGLPLSLSAQGLATSDRVTTAPVENPEFLELDANYSFFVQNGDLPGFSANDESSAFSLYQRARVGGALNWSTLKLKVELDGVTGKLYGDDIPEVPELVRTQARQFTNLDENWVDPREIYVTWSPGLAEVRLGLMTSDFGLGLVADDGRDEDWKLFNNKWGGDRGVRLLVATKPLAAFATSRTMKNVYLGLGADVVFQDDNANFIDGDRALQFIGSIFYRDTNPANHDDTEFLGVYAAYRQQTDREVRDVTPQDELNVLALDISGSKSWTADDLWISLGAEAALLSGDTTRTYTQSGETSTSLLALGAAAEAQLTWKPANVSLKMLSGYASGDADLDDDTVYRFRFDPNYKVGLVLFDQYIPAVTRESYERVTDPTRSGEPQRGVFGLVNDGAIENAVYLNPQLLFGRPDGLMTGVGLLWAWSAEPFYDPYSTFASGGTPTGINGRSEATRDLGLEVDVAAQYKYKIVSDLTLDLKAEYGIFFPGTAFDDAQGNSAAAQSLVRARVGLSW